MNLKEQLYVYTLSQTGSLLEASKILDITSSALSQYISNLENNLGADLFDRSGKEFHLTYLGEVYVESAIKMLDMKEDFDAILTGVSKNVIGRVRVGIQRYRSPYIAPQLMINFNKIHPNIKMELYEYTYELTEPMLLNGELNIFFSNIPKRREEFSYDLILQDLLVLMTPEDHPISNKSHPFTGYQYPWVDIHDLKSEKILLHKESQSSRMLVEKLFQENGFEPNDIEIYEQTDTILQMVSKGRGIAFLPSQYAFYPKFINPPKLYCVGKQQKAIEFSAVYRKDREIPNYALDIIELMKEIVIEDSNIG